MGVQTQDNSLILNSCEGLLFAVNLRVFVSNIGTKININAITMNETTSCFAVIVAMDILIILKAELSIVSVDCYCCFAVRWCELEILQKYL